MVFWLLEISMYLSVGLDISQSLAKGGTKEVFGVERSAEILRHWVVYKGRQENIHNTVTENKEIPLCINLIW